MNRTVNAGTLKVLAWPAIQGRLAARTAWSGSRQAAAQLEPSADPQEVEELLRQTEEALTWLRLSLSLPLGGASDITPLLGRVRRDASLQPDELLAVSDAARACRRCRQFMLERRECTPVLSGVAQALSDLHPLEDRIEQAIDREQLALRDSASPKLAQLRADIRRQEGRIRQHLDSLVASRAGYLQEALITIREGRFVVPVKAEHRAQVPGIVHDQSGSGATLFIEPLAVVEMNNELRQLRSQAQDEEERILAELSEQVRLQADRLEVGLEALTVLDLAQARGRLALDMDAVAPEVELRPRPVHFLQLLGARHPLLTGDVVPIDVVVGEQYDGLIITGPNTGGKTVALKTAGLLVLMVQAGLYPPARVARLSLFDRVFADIGDEQSIEQSLSTFSAHLRVIRQIADEADEHSLVLLDELGAGTDPVEGAALAQAILEHLLDRSCCVIATTHLGALKEFAYLHPRARNASVTFDEKSLQPTYHLVIGVPGSSNALSIARRLGLPAALTERATELMGDEQVRLEDVVRGLSAERQQAEHEREQAAAERQRWQARQQELADLREQHQQQLEQVRRLQRDLQQKAERQMEQAVRRTLAELEQLIGQARRQLEQVEQAQASASADNAIGPALEQTVQQLRQAHERVQSWRGTAGWERLAQETPALRAVQEQLARESAWAQTSGHTPIPTGPAQPGTGRADPDQGTTLTPTSATAPRLVWPPTVGTRVRLRRSGAEAVVRAEAGTDGRLEVQAGVIRLRLPLGEIEPWAARPSGGLLAGTAATASGQTEAAGFGSGVSGGAGRGSRVQAAPEVPVELDLRGTRADEALARLDKYLDQAVLANLPWVRIIHGKGTGALRAVVAEQLQQDHRVQRFRLGEPQEGGSGVTVAWLQ